jgi:ABC-type lipoprotein export system ATPase subunit
VAVALGVLVATHDRTVYDFATVVYELEDGQLTRYSGAEAKLP